MRPDGRARATIASEIVKLHSEYYGRGPTRARTHISDDLVAVVLEETFTPAEKTLIERGEADGVQQIRRRFQQVMRDQFVAIVEQATGRRVRSFISDTDLGADISIELFILADDRTDMAAFEPGQDEAAD